MKMRSSSTFIEEMTLKTILDPKNTWISATEEYIEIFMEPRLWIQRFTWEIKSQIATYQYQETYSVYSV